MSAIKVIKRTVELGGNTASSSFPDPIPPYFFNDETDAHMFMIFARRDGQPFQFTTESVSACFLNDIGTTVSIVGSIVNGAACVTLSDACYQVSGSFTLTISVSGAVVYECRGTVKVRSSGTAYDPTGEISVAALSAEIAEMRTATAAANTATAAANAVVSNSTRMLNQEINRATFAENKKIDKPLLSPDGTAGQILRTNGDGTTDWIDLGLPTDEQTTQAINNWLNQHPEATTTVLDNSLSTEKYQDKSVTSQKLSAELFDSIFTGTIKKTIVTEIGTFGAQDSAVSNGKLFRFEGFDSSRTDNVFYRVYDLTTYDVLYTGVLDGTDVAKPHANTATFGHKYSDSDTYPVIYLSGYNGLDGENNNLPAGTCFAYRIHDDFTTTLVQQIYLDDTIIQDTVYLGVSSTVRGNIQLGDFVVDTDNDYLYVLSTLITDDMVPKTRLFRFALPDFQESVVHLSKTDIIGYHDFPYYPWLQGATYHNNKIYISHGYANDGGGQSYEYAHLAVLNLETMQQIGYISTFDVLHEAEEVFCYNGSIYIGYLNLYRLSVPDIPFITNIGAINDINLYPNASIVDAINALFDASIARKVLPSNDLDEITECGIYVISYGEAQNMLNLPFPNTGTLLLVFGNAVTGFLQVAVNRTSGNLSRFAIRSIIDSSPASWRYLKLMSSDKMNVNRSMEVRRNNTYVIDVSSNPPCTFMFVGKSGANGIIQLFGMNGGEAWTTAVTGSQITVATEETNAKLRLTIPDYVEGAISLIFPTNAEYTYSW